MSVINKMLRDLDSRQAGGAVPAAGQGAMGGLTRGTFSVDPVSGEARSRGVRRGVRNALLALLLAGAAGVAVAWWFWWRAEPVRPPQVAPPMPVASAPARVEAPVAAASATPAALASAPLGAASQAQEPASAASAPMVSQMPLVAASAAPAAGVASAQVAAVAKAMASAGAVPLPAAPEPVAVSAPPKASAVASAASIPAKPAVVPAVAAGASAALAVKPASAVAAAKPASAPPPANKAVAAKPDTAGVPAPPATRSATTAAQETLAQAQGLWNAGSRDAGVEVLREAVAAAERANLAAQPGGLASFVMLVRELCRMELAEGHTAQVMTLLTRLEPVLAEQADIWALRGNAAQRLGRHQESATAYLAALKLRPSEPRWMLGAAVSLAAQGQTTAAAEWADKARAAGVVSPEVLNYLRQMGVPLR